MRAGMALEALSRNYRITLVVVSQNSATHEGLLSPDMRKFCERVWVRGLTKNNNDSTAAWIRSLPSGLRELISFVWPTPFELNWIPRAWFQELKSWLGSVQFDQAHVFRLSMMPIASKVLADETPLVLDLDDIESKALLRLTEIERPQLGRIMSAVRRQESVKLAKAEERVAARSGKVLVCSSDDRRELAARLGEEKVVEMPNGIRLPATLPDRHRRGQFRILFVGSLDYVPNQDAVEILAKGLAACISKAIPQGVIWRVAGRRPPRRLAELLEAAGIELIADAPSLDGHYEWADAVIVPLRSGGGTRIKILEALSWQLPVVSTTIGAEGLELQPEREILIADTDESFVKAFALLAGDEQFAENVAKKGRQKVEKIYAQPAISSRILSIHEDVGRVAGHA